MNLSYTQLRTSQRRTNAQCESTWSHRRKKSCQVRHVFSGYENQTNIARAHTRARQHGGLGYTSTRHKKVLKGMHM